MKSGSQAIGWARLALLAPLGVVVIGAVSAAVLAELSEPREPPATTRPAKEGSGYALRARADPGGASTLAVLHPAASVTRTKPTPVLMYHVIAPPPDDAPYPDLYVTPQRFRQHMAFLDRHGYQVVTLQHVWDLWHGGVRLPEKPVVITFDDGFRSWYTEAYPVLKTHGWVGTMNLAVSHLDRDISVRWVQRLVAAGWELNSHSLTHPDLTVLGQRDLRREVAGSRTRLRNLFHVEVNFFCYPSGRYDEDVLNEVRRAGYLGATTTVEGLAVPKNPFSMRRVRISGSDDVRALARKLG